ncbi:MAG: YitT family protein [Eubacteriales bacterium]|jgi:uncharacterized membrane-anchored protein YitT (DUF2179 family)
MNTKWNALWRCVRPTAYMIFGQLCYSVAINAFYAPNHVAGGGLAGIATVINYLIPIPIGLTTFLMSAPFLLIAWFVKGHSYTIRTLVSTVVSVVLIDLLAFLPAATDDRLVAAMMGGAIYAMGAASMVRAECSAGGSDLIARLMQHKWPHFSLGSCILAVDGLCVIAAALGYHDINAGIFSIIAVYSCSVFTDRISSGFQNACSCQIITQQPPQELAHTIQATLHRGVTLQSAEGMYHHQTINLLLVVVKAREVFKLKELVAQQDPSAFVVVTPVNEVKGGGFDSQIGHYETS